MYYLQFLQSVVSKMRKMFTRLQQHICDVVNGCGIPAADEMPRITVIRGKPPCSVLTPETPEDYKTPFQETHYNVRYIKPTDNQRAERKSTTSFAKEKVDPIQKLIWTHCLSQSEKGDAAKVAAAKLKYKQIYGVDCEKEVTQNDLPIPKIEGKSREEIRKGIEKAFMIMALQRSNKKQHEEQWNERPDIIQFESLDFYDAPHFQQSRVENSYTLDRIIDARAAEGVDGLKVQEGTANFWKALDDSHDMHEIAKVQSKIGDERPTDFSINVAKVKFDFDKDGNVVDMHHIASNNTNQKVQANR